MPKTFSDPGEPRAASSPQPPLPEATLSGPTMGTRWAARYQAPPGVDHDALFRDLARAAECVDSQMSPWKRDSDLMRLNRAEPGQWIPMAPEIMRVLDTALEVGRRSSGAFDIAVGGLVNAWGFGAERSEPDAGAIRHAASTHGPAHLQLRLDPGPGLACKQTPMVLDLCGIAKGYAVDCMAAVMRAHGIAHALLSLDGELRALGARADGRPWTVGLERPASGIRSVHGVLELADIAVATSGDYRRWFELGPGHRLAHSMDGRRSAPVRNPVASVTVLAPDCMHADAWATALLVAGPEDGLALAQGLGLEALFLLRRGDRLVELGTGRFSGA